MGRRPIPDDEKVKPSDFPQVAFRVSGADKEWILADVGRVAEALTKADYEGRAWTKGDVFVRALELGLKILSGKV